LLSEYSYDVTYPMANINALNMKSYYFPSTNSAYHKIYNKETSKVIITAKVNIPYYYGCPADYDTYLDFSLQGILVEKNM